MRNLVIRYFFTTLVRLKVQSMGKRDRLTIFTTGHGGQAKDVDGDENDGKLFTAIFDLSPC